ncbi:MAG: PAS domain S-box protein [Caldilineae bacterium]|nr:PAS domain S-box protein [Chloroflexota bacterium]MCB9177742.1 PAS domain S-box protein [Caldilineae bacterium]
MLVETLREIAVRPVRARAPRDIVARLRLVLPLAIFLVVVVEQAWEAVAYEDFSTGQRFLVGVLFYGLVGPALTYWTLDWIVRAIEARDAMEARAHEGERNLASIISSSASAIFSVDNQGIVQTWNRGAREIFGYAPEEIIGQHVSLLVPESLRQRGDLAIIRDKLLDRGFVRGYHTRRLTKAGREVHVDLTETLLRDEAGRLLGSSVILRDVSDRVEAETAVRKLNRELEGRVVERTRQLQSLTEELRAKNAALSAANAELKQLDALKDEFVSLVSHELRAPLTNINASTELMLLSVEDPKQRGKLEIIGHEASRLTRMVQSVLDVSRMEAGRLDLLTAPVEVDRLCQMAIDRHLPAGEPYRIAVAPDTPPVLADEDRALQVLGNLVSNAAKYSPAGSRIDLDARPAPGGQAVLFTVADRGMGIPPDELQRIFERFHRVERHDARETYGHGLGLYIARKIVEAHGGRIWVESTPGIGSTFMFTLPRAPEEP